MEFFSVSILEYEKEGLGIKITPNPSHGQRPHLINIKKHSKVILQQDFLDLRLRHKKPKIANLPTAEHYSEIRGLR